MTKSDSIKELATALAKAQGEIKGAMKDETNPFFNNSKYADLASVWNAIRGPLSKNGLSVVQIPGDGKIETMLMHSSGEWISGELVISPMKEKMNIKDAKGTIIEVEYHVTPQGVGSAITYGRRYALQAIAGVAPEDDDGEGAMARTNANADHRQEQREVKAQKVSLPPVNGQNWKEVVLHVGTIAGTKLGKLTPSELQKVADYMATRTGMIPEDKRLKEALIFAIPPDDIPMGDEELKNTEEKPF